MGTKTENCQHSVLSCTAPPPLRQSSRLFHAMEANAAAAADEEGEGSNVLQFHYEQLGAPGLLYRNRETFTVRDEDPRLMNALLAASSAKKKKKNGTSTATTTSATARRVRPAAAAAAVFCESQSDLYRSAARWYYPVDYHILQPTVPRLPPLVHELCRVWTRPPAAAAAAVAAQSSLTQKSRRQPPSDLEKEEASNGDSSGDDKDAEDLQQQEELPDTLDTSEPRNHGEKDDSHADHNDATEAANATVDMSYRATLRDLMREYGEEDDDDDFRDEGGFLAALRHEQQRPNVEVVAVDATTRGATGAGSTTTLPGPLRSATNNEQQSEEPRRSSQSSKRSNRGHAGTERIGWNMPVDIDQDDNEKDDDDDESTEEGGTTQEGDIDETANKGLVHPSYKERNLAVKRAFKNTAYSAKQIFGLQLKARAHMILTALDGSDRIVRHQARQKLRAYAQLDTNYIPGKEMLKYSKKKVGKRTHRRVMGLSRIVQQQTQLYDRERTNRADPAYMAPFHFSSLERTIAEDIQTRGAPVGKRKVLQEVPAIPRDDPHAPNLFGNCLISFPCQCGVCRSKGEHTPVPCLLHPVGPLQDRVRLSFLALPIVSGSRIIAGHHEPRLDIPEELNVGDRLRQLVQCGSDPYVFLARTDLHCTVFSVTFVRPRRVTPLGKDDCWGAANLLQRHRIDCRTLWRSMPSYRPIDVACHPRYGVGGDFTPSKVAVAYESTNGDRNFVHHMQIGSEALTVRKHVIANLQDISEIEFSSHHPMVLWAAARSYIRPVLTSGYLHKRPKIGHGASLYSIDLRSNNAATFQWSPSAEEFLPEGIHSVSGIHNDWSKDHCLWVSSVSAGKTWEIDTRMPCRALNVWSLPHVCDQFGSVLPPAGLYGAGIIFSGPYMDGQEHTINGARIGSGPMLCVGKSPGAFGLHLYQRPAYGPRFQTQSIECTACPSLANLGKLSVATSAVFPLPDVSDKVFTCGLATFRTPIQNFCEASSFSRLGYSEDELRGVICAVSLTNKGDIYSHTILESSASHKRGKSFDGLPLGCSVLPAPDTDTGTSSVTSWNVLRIPLSNDFPIPSHAISPALPKSSVASSIIDLSSFIEKEANDLRLELRREHMRKQREKRESQSEGNEFPSEANSSSSKHDRIENSRRGIDETKSDRDSSSERESDPESSTRVSVQITEQPKRSAVVSLTDGAATHLSLPPHLTPDAEDQHIEHFLRGPHSVAEGNSNSDKVWRSDLTPATLARSWEELDYASSDDSS